MADLRIRGQQIVAFREFVSVPELRFLISVALRNRLVVDQIGSNLKKAQLAEVDKPCAVAWGELQAHMAEHNSLPSIGILNTRIRAVLSRHKDILTADELKYLSVIVRNAYGDDSFIEDGDHVDMALSICRRFLQERVVADFQGTVMTSAGVQENVSSLLQDVGNSLMIVDSITAADEDELFQDGWTEETPEALIPFNVDVLDQLTGGGLARTETMTLMAPYGSCKTLTAVYGAARQAMWAHTEFENNSFDGKKPVVMHVSLETSKAQFQERILSFQACIPRRRLRHMTVSRLSRIDSVNSVPHQPGMRDWESTQYEEEIYGQNGWVKNAYVPEYDRAMMASRFIKEYVSFVDFTGANQRRSALIAEGAVGLAKVIRAYLRKNPDRVIVSLWIDHLSALVVDSMGLRNVPIEPAKVRTEIRATVRSISRELTKTFNIPVIILHQLNAEANSKGPTQQNHHTDGAECKSVAEFADFAVQAGNVTQDSAALCRFDCTKHRREPPRDYAIVHVDGAFTRLQDMSGDYVIATNQRRFVSRTDADRILGPQYTAAITTTADNYDPGDDNDEVAG